MFERLKEWLGWGGEDEEEYNNEELSSDQILIKFRTKAGAKSTELEHDFYHVPTRDEIELEFGPGIYNIYTLEEGHPKRRCQHKIEGNPIISVENYEIKLRVREGGKLLDTDTNFPAGPPPSNEEIINALGGGGIIKINARDKNNRTIWSEWRNLDYVEPPERYKKRDEGFGSKVEDQLSEMRRGVEDTAVKRLKGDKGEEEGRSSIDYAVDRVITAVEDTKMARLESALSNFADRIGGSKSESGGEGGLTKMIFSEPYLIKMDTRRKILFDLADRDPQAAMKEVEKMPDGISMGLKFGYLGMGFLEAATDYVKAQTLPPTPRSVKKEGETISPTTEKVEKDEEARAKEELKEMQERIKGESEIRAKETKTDTGFEISFESTTPPSRKGSPPQEG